MSLPQPPAGGTPRLRRGALAATALVLSLVPLSACAAGNDAATLGVKPDNAVASVGDIKIQNATIITQPDLKTDGPAVVSATLFNEGDKDQTLESITLPGTSAAVELNPAKGESDLVVPAGGSLVLGGKDNATAVIEDGREAAEGGGVQKVTFDLSTTGDVSLQAIIFTAKGYFEEYGPTPVPTATASASTSASPDAGESAEADPSGSASAGTDSGAAAGESETAEHEGH